MFLLQINVLILYTHLSKQINTTSSNNTQEYSKYLQ